ncbi:MAG: PssD/Cps14F family polysaccharide biosynthesis glycosyltransferase [Candidatus Aenigmatarchaeota archaeon]
MKICIVCSAGGHLVEIMQLYSLFKQYHRIFLTVKRKQAQELLKHEKVFYIEDPKRNPLKLLINFIQAFSILLKERPDVIISTGAGAALTTCYLGKIFGAKIVFIESLSAVEEPSLAGRLVYPITNLFIVQWRQILKFYKKAIYGGQLI